MIMPIHEYGDEFLRPTNQPWRCHKCGTELYTASSIISHKERCKGREPQAKSQYDIDRDRQVKESLNALKKKMGF
jgi:hypothetical protein